MEVKLWFCRTKKRFLRLKIVISEPGEFTKLAFQKKINLLKAESIADLISAETEIQRLQAVKMMKGKSSEKFNELRDKLLKFYHLSRLKYTT